MFLIRVEDGRVVTYEGVLVGELLKRAGVTLDGELRGDAMAADDVIVADDARAATCDSAIHDVDRTCVQRHALKETICFGRLYVA